MILALLQARMSSSRLPGKVLRPVLGEPMLGRQIERLARSKRFDRLLVATSTDPSDDVLADYCRTKSIGVVRGSLEDVLDRFYQAALPFAPDHVVRLTGDCPLTDPALIDSIIEFHLAGGYDYSSNTIEPTYPDGLDAEVVSFPALAEAWRESILPSNREHVTLFIKSRPQTFKLGSYRSATDLSHHRWTVDQAEDLAMVQRVYAALYPSNPSFATRDILEFLGNSPSLDGGKSVHDRPGHARNEGLEKSILKDERFMRGLEHNAGTL